MFTLMRIWSQEHKEQSGDIDLADGPVVNDRASRLVNFGSEWLQDAAKFTAVRDNKPAGIPIDVVEPGYMPGFM